MKEINDKEFNSEVIEHKGTVLVDFSADWCGPCRAMHPVLEEIAAEGDIKVVKIDIDKNQMAAQQHGVVSIPNMVVYRDGKMVNQMIGAMPKRQIMSELAV